jgi:hypothetical protein
VVYIPVAVPDSIIARDCGVRSSQAIGSILATAGSHRLEKY